jgi:saccharopine dehydrogenase-like NADP-dependent oxidoreductase
MQKILVIGAGGQGGPCVSILARDEQVSEIRLGDINFELASKVAEKIGRSKVEPMELDAGKKEAVIKAAEGVDALINLTLIDFNDNILEAALATKAHYVDTACNYEYLMQMVENKPLKYSSEFKALGKTALIGCGATPGMSNVCIRYVCDQMDTVEKIYLRAGYAEIGDSQEVVRAWDPGWSPEIALADFAEPPMIFENGQYKKVPIFSRTENYQFPEPVGSLLIASHSHEEPYTLPYYIEKGLKEVDFKYPVDPMAGAFVKMGFADDREIDVNGVRVVPRDVLMKLAPRPANAFLGETEANLVQSSDYAWIMEITVDGVKDGAACSYCLTDLSLMDKDTKLRLFHKFGSSHIGVALPAVVGAKMCLADNTDTGVISSECLDPITFFKFMAQMGAPVSFDEKIIKKTVFET